MKWGIRHLWRDKRQCGDSSCPSQQAPTPALAGDSVRSAQNDNFGRSAAKGKYGEPAGEFR
jgi:hypothetical protein